MSKTQVTVQNRGPGNTHREGTYLQLGSPTICVCVYRYILTDNWLINT